MSTYFCEPSVSLFYIYTTMIFQTIVCFQQFREGPFLFQRDNAPEHKARSIKKRFFSSFGLAGTEPWPQSHRKLVGWIETLTVSQALIAQHQWATSLMLLWLNGSKSLQPLSRTTWKAFPGVSRLVKEHNNPCDSDRKILMCPHIFGSFRSCVCFGVISLSFLSWSNKGVFVLLLPGWN